MKTLRELLGGDRKVRKPFKDEHRAKPEWLFKHVNTPRELEKRMADGWELVSSTPILVNGTTLFTQYLIKKHNT